MLFKVGFGQDSHAFCENKGKKLILGGVIVEGERGLKANSDGDVILHAVCSAIEQARGKDNFSVYADKMCAKGIKDSSAYLAIARDNLKKDGFAINNLGISVEAGKPRILPLQPMIKKRLAEILRIDEKKIGINATSGENLTAFGRGEGIQAFAIVSIVKKPLP